MKASKSLIMSGLDDVVKRSIFFAVVDARHIRLDQLESKALFDITRDQLEHHLNDLVMNGLLEKSVGVLSDWNVYFVTAEGLGIHRQLKRQK